MSNKLKSLTTSLTKFGGNNPIYNLNFPQSSIDYVTSIESNPVSSLEDLAIATIQRAASMNSMVHTAYCIGRAITDPSMLLGVLDQMAGNLAATAIDMANRIVNCIGGQIQGAISRISGSVIYFINSVIDFLNAIDALIEQLSNIINNLLSTAKSNYERFAAQDDCEFFLASIAQCLMNKMLGSKLQNFEQKVTYKILQEGSNFNDAVSSELASVDSLSNFIQKETFMANKATAQLEMFNQR